MKKSEHLFFLVKSLSGPEKRYFRLQTAAQGADNNYLRLFDAIAQQGVYDESAIRRRFRGETFLRQLHVTKNYLSRMILKSLRSYHEANSREAEIRALVQEARILFRRDLLVHCRNHLSRAERLADRYELFPVLMEVYALQRRLLLSSGGAGRESTALNALSARESIVLARMARQAAYWELSINIFTYLSNPQQYPQFLPAQISAHPLLGDEQAADSHAARRLYCYIWQTIYIFRGETASADLMAGRMLALMAERPDLIRENPNAYVTALNNRVGICLRRGDYQAIPEILHTIRRIPRDYGIRRRSPLAVRMVLHTYNLELEMYRDRGDTAAGLALVPVVDRYLESPGLTVPDDYRLLLYYQFSYLYFLQRDFEAALRWLNEIFRRNFDNARQDILVYAQLLRLIVHYELGNTTILKYSVDALRRSLGKRPSGSSRFEKRLLRFFSRASLTPVPDRLPLVYKLYRDLFVTSDEQYVAELDYLDVKSWLEEKMEG